MHLDGDEAKEFLALYGLDATSEKKQEHQAATIAVPFAIKLASKIHKLIKEIPNLLEDRTEDQIKASLQGDLDKILGQQHAMSSGKDWKKVKG